MRRLFGMLALVLGLISMCLAARYGYKGTDTLIDGVISAVVFGAIALCAFLFDAAAVRLWFMRHHLGAIVIGVIAALALVVTFTNSLGAIAARGDTTLAERRKVKTDSSADEAQLKRIGRERDAMVFMATTTEAVQAAREAVRSAEEMRQRECGNGEPKQRGPNCRQRETDEQSKRDALAIVLANKALTDRAAKLDQDVATVRARLNQAPPVENPNPLGATLELLLGAAATALTAWQQAVVAGVFELCLVGVMVIYELLGQGREPQPISNPWWKRWRRFRRQSEASSPSRPLCGDAGQGTGLPSRSKRAPHGSVKAFIHDRVAPADGARVEVKALLHDYRAWCSTKGVQPVALAAFLEDIEAVCRKVGVEIINEADRVFCLGIKIEDAHGARRIMQ